MAFIKRMGKGFKRLGELKEKFQKSQLERAEKKLERQERYAKVYEAEAKMYSAAARREQAKQKYSQLRTGGFGGQNPIVNYGSAFEPAKQPQQKVRVVYAKPKKKVRKVRYVTQAAKPEPSFDDRITEFMRR